MIQNGKTIYITGNQHAKKDGRKEIETSKQWKLNKLIEVNEILRVMWISSNNNSIFHFFTHSLMLSLNETNKKLYWYCDT